MEPWFKNIPKVSWVKMETALSIIKRMCQIQGALFVYLYVPRNCARAEIFVKHLFDDKNGEFIPLARVIGIGKGQSSTGRQIGAVFHDIPYPNISSLGTWPQMAKLKGNQLDREVITRTHVDLMLAVLSWLTALLVKFTKSHQFFSFVFHISVAINSLMSWTLGHPSVV